MSNGIKFVLLLSAILVVMFSLAFAQAEPFQAEVLVQTARMRWGPGSAFAVQHYANLGHVLTVLEADAESDPPWTWYYARTASGVQSWIRGDLIRRTDAAVPIAARPNNPTGSYPVIDNNLCNTSLFRTCQDGTDHDLWEAGYWANDRYDHWERGGWNLNIVYHQNPCKADRVCTTREAWDAGHQEAQMLAASATPDVTVTPVVIQQTVEVEVGVREIWEIVQSFTASTITLEGNTVNLYNPLDELKTDAGNGSIFGGFRISSESINVYCHHWYRTAGGALVKQSRQRVDLNRLPDDVGADGTRTGEDRDYSNVRCFTSSVDEDDVVARYWEITLTRSYQNFAGISGITWRLTATHGTDEPDDMCIRVSKCTPELLGAWRTALGSHYTGAQPTATPPARTGIRVARALFLGDPDTGKTCRGRTSTEGEEPNERTRYEYTCEDTGDNSQHDLTFHFTHTDNRYVAPTAEPG